MRDEGLVALYAFPRHSLGKPNLVAQVPKTICLSLPIGDHFGEPLMRPTFSFTVGNGGSGKARWHVQLAADSEEDPGAMTCNDFTLTPPSLVT